MKKKNKENIIVNNVEIIDIADEGKAIAKIDGLVIFVKNVVPGDVVDVAIYKKKKSYAEAKVLNIIKQSPYREIPFCEHFGVCGGCKWQNLSYEKQLQYKQQQVLENFNRIGKVDVKHICNPIVASDHTKFYRNKLEYTFSNKRWLLDIDKPSNDEMTNMNALGFHIPGCFDRVLKIDNCYLQPDPSNEIRNAVYQYAIEQQISFFDFKSNSGLLRNLIIRNNINGDVMVLFSFYERETETIVNLLNYIKNKFPMISSLMFVINNKKNDTISDLNIELFSGENFITENLESIKYKISPISFFQTNPYQALKLYKIVRAYANLDGSEIVYDLYTGTGSIANFIASNAKKVIGIDYIEDAIVNARENSINNNIINTEFYSGDMVKILTQEFISNNGIPDVVITDPPRAGMHKDVVTQILNVAPKKIIYVSCNAATQARDVKLMKDYYKITAIQAVDMFPHTHHVENVVLLEKY